MKFARVLRLSALFLPLATVGCNEGTETPAASPSSNAASITSAPPSHDDDSTRDAVAGSTGAVTIVWAPPSHNEDGSPLDDLAGFRIRYGASAERLTAEVAVQNPDATNYLLEGLMPGPYYFIVSAIDYDGQEGLRSDPQRILVN